MRDFIVFRQLLNRTVGKLGDVANMAGSIHARLAYIIHTSLNNIYNAIYSTSKYYGQRTSLEFGEYVSANGAFGTFTVCDISGAGYLYRATSSESMYSSNYGYLVVTIDGVAKTFRSSSLTNTATGFNGNIGRVDVIGPIKFTTNLKVEVVRNTGSNGIISGFAQWGIDQ